MAGRNSIESKYEFDSGQDGGQEWDRGQEPENYQLPPVTQLPPTAPAHHPAFASYRCVLGFLLFPLGCACGDGGVGSSSVGSSSVGSPSVGSTGKVGLFRGVVLVLVAIEVGAGQGAFWVLAIKAGSRFSVGS